MTNPLLTPSALPYGVPDWAAIKPEHILPAARAAMEDQRAQWEGIATNPEPATVENIVVAFDKSNDVINRALASAFTPFSSMGGPELEKIQATLGPVLSALTNAFWLDRRMFERFEAVDLSEAEEETRYFVEDTLKKFQLKGIDMSEEEQAKLKEIDSQLSSLEILFSQRATKAWTTTRSSSIRATDWQG